MAIDLIKKSDNFHDLPEAIPLLLRYQQFELVNKISPTGWLEFLMSDRSRDLKFILGTEFEKQFGPMIDAIIGRTISPSLFPETVKVWFENPENRMSNSVLSRIPSELMDYIFHNHLGIMGQIMLYQTSSTFHDRYKSVVRESYMTFEKNRRLSVRRIFKLWKRAPEGSPQKEDLRLFLGIHTDFKQYAPFIFDGPKEDFQHFPNETGIDNVSILLYDLSSPIFQMLMHGINPGVVEILIKTYETYMFAQFDVLTALYLLNRRDSYPFSLLKTIFRKGTVCVELLLMFMENEHQDQRVVKLLLNRLNLDSDFSHQKINSLLLSFCKPQRIEYILDGLETGSLKINQAVLGHCLKCGVNIKKLARVVKSVNLCWGETIDCLVVDNLLQRGGADQEFVIKVLESFETSGWLPTRLQAKRAFELDYPGNLVLSWILARCQN